MKKIFLLMLIFAIFQGKYCPGQTILVLCPGPSEAKGAELSDYYPTTNFGTSAWFDANAWTVLGTPIKIRSLMQFDLTQISPNTPIISATLSLFNNPACTHYQLQAGDNQSYLLRVSEPWDDQVVCWADQPEVSMENPVLIPTSTYNTQSYPDIDVTAHVQDMINNPGTNYGWEIRLVTEELYRSMQFSSGYDEEQYRPILTIVLCEPPVADWSYQVQGDTVFFTDLSSSSPVSWFWDFGDGYASYLQNPFHLYSSPGQYNVCLTITDSCGTATKCDTVISCLPLDAYFIYETDSYSVAFQDSSVQASTWFWSFGDGFYSDLQNPLHVFNDSGNFYVCLTVSNNCTTETFCDSVLVSWIGVPSAGEDQIRIFPVPSYNSLYISRLNHSAETFPATITDISGKILLQKEVTLPGPDGKYEIDLTNFAAGSYFIRMNLQDKTVVRKFIVVK